MGYGMQTYEKAAEIAKESGVNLFKVGDKVVTNHGTVGEVAEVVAYGDGNGRLFWNMCCYALRGDDFGRSVYRMDFIDAHKTLGGCLKAA